MKKIFQKLLRHFYYKQYFLWVSARTFFWSNLFGSFGKSSHIFGQVAIFYPENIQMGDHCALDEGVLLNARASILIGDHVHMSPGVILTTGSMRLDQKYPERQRIIMPIKVGSGTWIAARAIIFPGVTIGENAVISANSVVNKDVPDNALVAGSPAKVVAYLPYRHEQNKNRNR